MEKDLDGRSKVLSRAEISRLWRSERQVTRLFALATTVLAAAMGLVLVYPEPSEVRYFVLLLALGLLLASVYVQFTIRCPRCRARLATQSLLFLPEKCKVCGVTINHPHPDDELDV